MRHFAPVYLFWQSDPTHHKAHGGGDVGEGHGGCQSNEWINREHEAKREQVEGEEERKREERKSKGANRKRTEEERGEIKCK